MADQTALASALQSVPHLANLEKVSQARFGSLDITKLFVYFVDTVDASALPRIAEQFDITGIKGYGLVDTDEEKRRVIKEAIEISRCKGTPYAIKLALRWIGFNTVSIIEGAEAFYDAEYKYDGEIDYGSTNWANFYVRIQAGDIDITQAKRDIVDLLINEFKNVRSKLVWTKFSPVDDPVFNQFSGYFDGSTAMSAGNPSVLQITNNLTVFARFKADASASAGSAGHIVAKMIDTTNLRSWFIAQSTVANQIIIRTHDDGTNVRKSYIITLGDITDWNSVAFTFTTNNLQVYLNGINVTDSCTKATNSTCNSLYDTTAPVSIGCSNYTTTKSNFFKGYIDDVQIYNVVKTDQEIYDIDNHGVSKDEISNSGIVGYWSFENNLDDRSPSGITLSSTIPPIIPQDIDNDYSASFDGTSQYIGYGNPSALQILNNLTVIIRVKANGAYGASNRNIICKTGTTSGNYRGWTITQTTTTNQIAIIIDAVGTGSGATAKQYRVTLSDITIWNSVAFTFSTNVLKIFVNGIDVTASATKTSDGTVNAIYNTPMPVEVGACSDDSRFFNGKVDEVLIFNSVKTEAEILAIHNYGTPLDESAEANLQLYARFENNATDSGPNNITGTNNGATFSSDVPYNFYDFYRDEVGLGTKYIANTETKNSYITTILRPGILRKNPLSEVQFVTTDTTLKIGVFTENYGETTAKIALYQNGTHFATYAPSANGYSEYKFTGLTAGSKTILLRNGGAEWLDPGKGTYVVKVFKPNYVYVANDNTKTNVIIVGDSISQGKAATYPTREGWVTQIKETYNGNVCLYGGSGMLFKSIAGDATLRSNFVTMLADYIVGTNANKILFALGTNDYGAVTTWSHTNFKTGVSALIAAIKTAYPDLEIILQGPTVRTTETANSLGSTLANYITALSQLASENGVTFIDAHGWILAGDLADYVHPNTTGHGKIKTNSILNL